MEAGQGRGCLRRSLGFTGQRSPFTRNGVWHVVKGLMAAVGLGPRYATHSCRHTYPTHLYRACGGDLEVVQEQLGHASIKTTTICVKVTKEDKARAADALAKAYRNSQHNGRSGASRSRRAPLSRGIASQNVASFWAHPGSRDLSRRTCRGAIRQRETCSTSRETVRRVVVSPSHSCPRHAARRGTAACTRGSLPSLRSLGWGPLPICSALIP